MQCSFPNSLNLTAIDGASSAQATVAIDSLIIAGWTGRDPQAMESHIVELEKLGIKRPKSTPIFYRGAASLLTTSPIIEVVGHHSSGEVEPVIFSLPSGLWLGVGSDHTDRKIEAIGITLSKQLCGKPVGDTVWRFDEVANHWDDIIIRSSATNGGKTRLYQEGPLKKIRHPTDLMNRYCGSGKQLHCGTAMFCGTLAVNGEIEPAEAYELQIEDPVLKRSITHCYKVSTLPTED